MAPEFRNNEKSRYRQLKGEFLSAAAAKDGTYPVGERHDFCIENDHSEENLFKDIRDDAISYFKQRRIPWHDGIERRQKPSNHLCCSQSCCVNFLFPLIDKPVLIKNVFSKYYPEFLAPLPINLDGSLPNEGTPYLSFEWIGADDYLGESKRKEMRRTRGANFTSADFIIRFKRKDGKIQAVLGEWKYTEEYGKTNLGIDTRKKNYIQAFERDGGVFIEPSSQLYDSLFFDPFYQLMRLQLLAQEMEVNHEMDADIVSILHVSPKANVGFRNHITSRYLEKSYPGKTVLEIWEGLVKTERFKSISVEDMLQAINQAASTKYSSWVDYLNMRYGWR